MTANLKIAGEDSSEFGPAYGAMRSVMADHFYNPVPNARMYTSPCIVAKVTTPFDVMLAITACRLPVTIEMGESKVEGSAVLVGARERRLDARGVKLICVQLDPFHPSFPLLRRHHGALALDREAFAPLDAHLEAAYQGTLSLTDSQELLSGVVDQLNRQLPRVPPLDPRVINVMHLLQENPRMPVEALAQRNGISYDRMSHLFIDELGISIRSFQVWVKLHRAMTGIRYGQSLIELARLAGFSDAAHLSRVYKQVYGAPPSYFYFSGNVKLIASFAGDIPGAPPRRAAVRNRSPLDDQQIA